MALVKRSLTNNSSFLAHKRVCYSSSSEEDNNSRAGFVSSDDDDEEQVNNISAPISGRRMSLLPRAGSFVCKPNHSRKNSSDFLKAPEAIRKLVYDSDNDNRFLNGSNSVTYNERDFNGPAAVSPVNKTSISDFSVASSSDLSARLRCFDYLVGAIDEAWARFCDATSYADYNTESDNDDSTSKNDDDDNDYYDNYDDDNDYKSDGTDLTDYEYNTYSNKLPITSATAATATATAPSSSLHRQHQRHFSISNTDTIALDSSSPESAKMQSLKYRLLRAKNYLQDFVESDESNDAKLFWARWDLIKYATIELVEDDDDDDLVEDTIEDLEKGRCY